MDIFSTNAAQKYCILSQEENSSLKFIDKKNNFFLYRIKT